MFIFCYILTKRCLRHGKVNHKRQEEELKPTFGTWTGATGNNTWEQFFIWFSGPSLSAWLIKKTSEHSILWVELTFTELRLRWRDFQPPISTLVSTLIVTSGFRQKHASHQQHQHIEHRAGRIHVRLGQQQINTKEVWVEVILYHTVWQCGGWFAEYAETMTISVVFSLKKGNNQQIHGLKYYD